MSNNIGNDLGTFALPPGDTFKPIWRLSMALSRELGFGQAYLNCKMFQLEPLQFCVPPNIRIFPYVAHPHACIRLQTSLSALLQASRRMPNGAWPCPFVKPRRKVVGLKGFWRKRYQQE
ncbi:unnamed protein product [Protopolystoma xenopodis]|uniref:Uncharacterized protein n=1 Tax=Protopolystoma xenopodis TaxID=117903 RepID=A0A3S5A843_9PLAT|nr:unnamed protein product [Protopolystoma xenopodis]